MRSQLLTLRLDGITASDYLAGVADGEPPALGRSLRSVEVDADPLGSTVHVALAWSVPPPAAEDAAALAGLPLTPEVTSVRAAPPVVHHPPADAASFGAPDAGSTAAWGDGVPLAGAAAR